MRNLLIDFLKIVIVYGLGFGLDILVILGLISILPPLSQIMAVVLGGGIGIISVFPIIFICHAWLDNQ